jgi:hypothetical protein
MGAEEECNDAMSLEPLGELLVTDMDAVDVAGDVAVTPFAGAGGDKLCCSYKKCNNQLLSKEQMPCSGHSFKKTSNFIITYVNRF